MKSSVTKVLMVMVLLSAAMTMSAQRYNATYEVKGNKVMYAGQLVREADASSFQILGYGYAKDRYNVYLNGDVLNFVDPQSFRLKTNAANGESSRFDGYFHGYNGTRSGYMVTKQDVYFDGRKVQGARANSFRDLGQGYGMDAYNVFFMGEKIKYATRSSFKVLSDGYSKDAFRVYFYGEEVKGANAATFKVDNRGYAHDAFSYFYNGMKLAR